MGPNTALKLAIFKSGLTQWEIAAKAGIHETRLSKIVRGRLLPTGDEKKELARALGCRVLDLFQAREAMAS